MGAAITLADRLHARSRAFQRRVDASLRVIEQAVSIGKVGISFSGGKDSTCLLDLVRRVDPAAPAAFYDSGAEYPSVYELVSYYDVETIQPQRSLVQLCKDHGYWGHAAEVEDAEVDFFAFLVGEPAARFVYERSLAVVAMGLRAEESVGRRLSAYRRGKLYQLKSGLWHLCPLADWTADDVFAYIASRDLRYNVVYDQMAQLGIPRDRWRISALLGLCGAATLGRYAYLRQLAPGLFNRLLIDFPKIRDWT